MTESRDDVTLSYQSAVNSMTDVKSESMDEYETPFITPDMFVQGLSVAGSELGVTITPVTPSVTPSIAPSTVSTPTTEKRTARKTGQGPKRPVTLVTGSSEHATGPKRVLGSEVDQEWSLMDCDGSESRRRGRRGVKVGCVIGREVSSADEEEILGARIGSSDDDDYEDMDENEENPGGLQIEGTPLAGRNVTTFDQDYSGSEQESDHDRRKSRRSSRKRKPKYQDPGSDQEEEYEPPKRGSRSRSSSKKGSQKKGSQKRGKREEKSSEKWVRPKRPAYVPLTAIVTPPTDTVTTVTCGGRVGSSGKATSAGGGKGRSSHEGSHRASMDRNGPSPATGRHSFLQRSNRVWNTMEKEDRDHLLTKYILPVVEGTDATSDVSKTTWKVLPFNESCSMCHVSFDDPGE